MAERKGVEVGVMLQTLPRVPVAGVKRRWSGRSSISSSLQESSSEVSSSGILSSTSHFYPTVPGVADKNDDLQFWDLDLHGGLASQGHVDHPVGATTDQSTNESRCPTSVEGTLRPRFSN